MGRFQSSSKCGPRKLPLRDEKKTEVKRTNNCHILGQDSEETKGQFLSEETPTVFAVCKSYRLFKDLCSMENEDQKNGRWISQRKAMASLLET